MSSFLARDCVCVCVYIYIYIYIYIYKILPIAFVYDTVDVPPRHSTRIIFMFAAIRSVHVWFGSLMLHYVMQSNIP